MSAADDRYSRYNRSEKGKARSRAYDRRHGRSGQTNDRRVFVGQFYAGMATTPEHATVINTHTREHFARRGEDK